MITNVPVINKIITFNNGWRVDLRPVFVMSSIFTTGTTLVGQSIVYDRTDVMSAYTTSLAPLFASISCTTFNSLTIQSGNTDLLDIFEKKGNISSNFYTTATTLVGATMYFNRNDVLSAYSVSLASINGTISANTLDTATLKSGGTDLNSIFIKSYTDNYTTAATLSTSTIQFDRNNAVNAYSVSLASINGTISANTLNAATIKSGNTDLNSIFIKSYTDNYTTAATLSTSTIQFDRNNAVNAYSVSLASINGTISANTLNASTVQSGGTDLLSIFALKGSSGNNYYTTAATLNNTILQFDRTDQLSAYTIDLKPISNQYFVEYGISDSINPDNLVVSAGLNPNFGLFDGEIFSVDVNSDITNTNCTLNVKIPLDQDIQILLIDGSAPKIGNILANNRYLFQYCSNANINPNAYILLNPSYVIDSSNNAYTTGATYDDSVKLITFNRNDAAAAYYVDLSTLTVPDIYTTAATLNAATIQFERTDAVNAYSVSLASIGGTVSATTLNAATIKSGNTDLNSIFIKSYTDNYTTAATLSTSTIQFDRNNAVNAYSVSLASINGTISANTLNAATVQSGGTDMMTIIDNRVNASATIFAQMMMRQLGC